MKKHVAAILVIVFISCPILINVKNVKANDTQEAYKLYQQVISGKTKIENLSVEQQKMVLAIHNAISRSDCDELSEECCNAKEQASSYRDDLEAYTRKLLRCVEGNDLTYDCYTEFRRVKSAHSDFEYAISDVNSYCD